MVDIFVPGRLLIVGDHSDWVGQFKNTHQLNTPTHAIISGINQGIYASCEKAQNITFIINGQTSIIPLDKQQLLCISQSNDFLRSVAGTVLEFYKYGGISIKITNMDLPMGKGLASSAAICVLIVRAYNILYKLGLSVDEEMAYAYQGEANTGSGGGRGDQACAFGNQPVHMIFDGDTVSSIPIAVKNNFYFLIADLHGCKSTKIICNDLQSAFKNNLTSVQDFLLHDNTNICLNSVNALESGDAEKLGYNMNLSFDLFNQKMVPFSYEQLKGIKLNTVINDKNIWEYSLGAKGVGAQGDGSIQILCKSINDRDILSQYLYDKYDLQGLNFTLQGDQNLCK